MTRNFTQISCHANKYISLFGHFSVKILWQSDRSHQEHVFHKNNHTFSLKIDREILCQRWYGFPELCFSGDIHVAFLRRSGWRIRLPAYWLSREITRFHLLSCFSNSYSLTKWSRAKNADETRTKKSFRKCALRPFRQRIAVREIKRANENA